MSRENAGSPFLQIIERPIAVSRSRQGKVALFPQAVERLTREYGKNDVRTAMAMYNTGRHFHAAGNWTAAKVRGASAWTGVLRAEQSLCPNSCAYCSCNASNVHAALA